MYGNVFLVNRKTYDSKSRPVWLNAYDLKYGGGIREAGKLVPGTVIKAGTPVRLDTMGGKIQVFEEFRVLSAVSADATSAQLQVGSFGTEPAVGMRIGKITEAGLMAKVGAITAVTPSPLPGMYEVTIAANAFGVLAKDDVLVFAPEDSADTNVQVEFKPTGLTYDDAWIEEGTTHWTCAVVTKGQIIDAAIPKIPAFIKEQLVSITFEKEG